MPGLGISFGRGGATGFQQDLANADCILIQGSNMAECHPVGFQWVMEAKERGATLIHVDPRYTRTSAMSHLHVPIRVGTDIAFLGGLVRYILENERYFRDYNSSVPIWQQTYRTLPLLFMSSAAASRGAFLELFSLDTTERRVLRTFHLGGTAAALGAACAVWWEASRSARVVRPLQEGVSGALWKASLVCTAPGGSRCHWGPGASAGRQWPRVS